MSIFPLRPLATALHAHAAALREAAASGTGARPLRGRNVALLTPDATSAQAVAVTHAARALGAQVVHVRPDSLPPATSPARADTLALLGRLYDAVVAENVSPDLLAQVTAQVDRPVLIENDGEVGGLADDWLLQAWLVEAMA